MIAAVAAGSGNSRMLLPVMPGPWKDPTVKTPGLVRLALDKSRALESAHGRKGSNGSNSYSSGNSLSVSKWPLSISGRAEPSLAVQILSAAFQAGDERACMTVKVRVSTHLAGQ
jgi:hypothetical protein